ncbi:E3 ubiquitin-protein ligase DCST1 [Acipenser oxyrinchus oxyrinchus]|uniref:E3 ubiquitin-protein ligase DCST1 n=1 Tax=Acipenser oxyrinchus oxyrinchus TaxID=40147 RepID=A0AAD8FP11_ACIOX|nr:E3 ubiquitin-protein ligase DCST1 [Acipenser oxyrinchus oxyrinchus]
MVKKKETKDCKNKPKDKNTPRENGKPEEKDKPENRKKTTNRKAPRTTLHRVCTRVLPRCATRFLFSGPKEFPVTKFMMGMGFGALFGIVLYYGLVHKLSMYEEHKIYIVYALIGVCALGWGFSSQFRCSILLIAPNMLGAEGRAYIMVFVLAGLYHGPIANINNNVQDVAYSMGCTVEMQVNHSKQMWRVMMDPFKQMVHDMVEGKKDFEKESKEIQTKFSLINEQVMGEYGYSNLNSEAVKKEKTTQERFDIKTKLRCEYVVEEGVYRCKGWFKLKWKQCMDTIKVPIINHILCIPMTFDFLCNIMKLMTKWCKDKIPVEGNFGQTYDMLNDSVEHMGEEFSSSMVVKKTEQESLVGMKFNKAQITEDLKLKLNNKKTLLNNVMGFIQVLLSCTFVFIFISAFGYSNKYNRDIRFDNIYINTYFRQIDARRKKLGKRHLLPFKKAERCDFIFPWSLSMHASEIKTFMMSMLQIIPLAIFIGTLLAIDWSLYKIFRVIRKHSYTEYSFSSSHHIEITVGGRSMLATLLRKTIGAFNTSSNTEIKTNNLRCLPDPQAMSRSDYLWTILPILAMTLLCCLQVYTSRLRRVIASFYFPQKEKKRTLFLYNEQIRKRITYVETQRKRIMMRARVGRVLAHSVMGSLYRWSPCLRCCVRRRCFVCSEVQSRLSFVCPAEGCGTVYCRQCWKDMRQFCFACTSFSFSEFISDDGDSEYDMKYAH